MASLPNPQTVTYEEWLRMPEVTDAIEEVVDGEILIMPPNKLKSALIVGHIWQGRSMPRTDAVRLWYWLPVSAW